MIPLLHHQAVLDGITFASSPSVLFAPAQELGVAFGLSIEVKDGSLWINGSEAALTGSKPLPDGTLLIPLRLLSSQGVQISWNSTLNQADLTFGDIQVSVRRGAKSVVIDKSKQELTAMQGDRVVMVSKVSTGMEGHNTPNGTFRAGPYKALMHRSRLYNNAPMPFSVQINGHVFIHGFDSVPDRPASHGCIRLPVNGGNPAKFFYDWIDVGTPVTIQGEWED